jgi:hypothetical protein
MSVVPCLQVTGVTTVPPKLVKPVTVIFVIAPAVLPVNPTVMAVAADLTLEDSVTDPVAYVPVTERVLWESMSPGTADLVVTTAFVIAGAAGALMASPVMVQVVTSPFPNVFD